MSWHQMRRTRADMKLLYFAWLRERIGLSEEELSLPDGVTTVEALITHLTARGGGYASAFCEPAAVKVAINQDFARITDTVADSDEVAFFPPVTGG